MPSPSNRLLKDPGQFPLAVWLQSPNHARRYQACGINLYVALWQGPTEEQLTALRAADMPVICAQNDVGLAQKGDAGSPIVGWMHGDEPDNAQAVIDPKTGKQTWGPCIPPARIVSDYEAIKRADPSRPVLLNLGQGVANDDWKGRGSGARLEDYATYVKGGDILSFDVYPVAGLERADGADYLWYVAKGVERLMRWSAQAGRDAERRIWSCIECSRIDGRNKPNAAQVRTEVWMALIHGARGLIYFVHQFKPTFNEHALLDDPELRPAVTALNREIQNLAPVLNSPTIPEGVTVASADPRVPIALMRKRYAGATYLFAVGMRNGGGETRATFTLQGVSRKARAEVLGENRAPLPLTAGAFTDTFRPYEVHLYRIG